MPSRKITGPLRLTSRKTVTTGDFTITTQSVVVVNKASGAATAVTLPPSLAIGLPGHRIIEIIDGKGDAGSNNITVTAAGSDTINGSATLVMNSNYGCKRLHDVGGGKWVAG